jgi:hypothetical protein
MCILILSSYELLYKVTSSIRVFDLKFRTPTSPYPLYIAAYDISFFC